VLTARAAVGSSAIEDIIARYTGPRFGFASKNFYPEFLAALKLSNRSHRPANAPRGERSSAECGERRALRPAPAGNRTRPPSALGARGGRGKRAAHRGFPTARGSGTRRTAGQP
jgi:hypothetical protein